MIISRKLTVFLLMGVLLIALAGCVPAGLRRFFGPPVAERGPVAPAATATPTPVPAPTNTPLPPPTATPQPKAPTATPTPQTSGELTVHMTEEEVNAYVASKSFSQDGAGVSNLHVEITPAEMVIKGYVQHEATGLAGDITIIGVPVVVDNELYFQVGAVTLGPQFSGLVRTIAGSLIQEMIKQEAGPNGLPIPVELPEGMIFSAVTLGEGELILEGMRN